MYAVLKMWNDGSYYVNAKLTQDLPVWIGVTASQKVIWQDKNGTKINEKCILEGGAKQILLDQKVLNALTIKVSVKPTKWP